MEPVSQFVGDNVLYQQDVMGDTIVSAEWFSSPAATIGTPVNTGTSSTVLFQSQQIGLYTLTVSLTLASGQVKSNQVLINVVSI